MKKTFLPALAVASLFLASCSGSGSPKTDIEIMDGSMDELYAAAQEEGTITIYGPTEDLYSEVYDDFKETYPGIEVVTSDIFGQELDTRLEGELASGELVADLVHIGVSDVERYHEKGYLSAFRPLGTEELDDQFIGQDEMWSVASQHLYLPSYNSDQLSENEVPKNWGELTSESWNGRISTANPKQSGVTPQMLSSAIAAGAIDEAWIDEFKANVDPMILPSVANALQTTVTGETDISLVTGYGTYARQVDQGAPLELIVLDDGVYFSDVAFAALEGSPNPNASRLLVSWMYTPEGQASIAEHVYEFGTMPDAPAPAGAEELDSATSLPYPGAEKYRETLNLLATEF